MTLDEMIPTPEQEFELCVDTHGIHEYSLKYIHIFFYIGN